MTSHKNLTISDSTAIAGLTKRQQQILKLMQQGKVNKEIANDLNISLGTVKQHLVAVFKKLNVQNRTMAVARLAEFKDQSGFDAVFSQEVLIARRPAIILSLKITNQLPLAAMRLFHTHMAEIAFNCRALFISRERGDGDLIFGLKRSSTQDIRMAVQVAGQVFNIMESFAVEQLEQTNPEPVLTGALVAGLISVSQNRFGGWSGETVGSYLLTMAHKLRANTPASHLAFDSSVLTLMQGFDLTAPANSSGRLLFSELPSLNRWDIAKELPLVGRDQELKQLNDLLAEKFRVLIIEGENGMGKSRLCREASRLALKQGRELFYIHALPSGIFCSEQFQYLECLNPVIAGLKHAHKSLLVLDDAHHLTEENKTLLVSYLNNLSEGTQVILCGRQPQRYAIKETLHSTYRLLHLNRLNDIAVTSMLSKQPEIMLTSILERARGIPLFVKELSSYPESDSISLALMITIASRIDKFKVDWKLLYCIASHSQPVSLKVLSDLMKDDLIYIQTAIEHAEALGVLDFESNQAAFRHPLVQKTISYLFRPNSTANIIK